MRHEVIQPGRVLEGRVPAANPDTTVEKLIHLALPVRLIHMQNGGRGGPELACTYDIHPRGARLLSCRDVKVGDLITIERGRNKSVCQVIWTAHPESVLRGQFTVECIEGSRIPWEEELRHAQEQYLPVVPEGANRMSRLSTGHVAGQNRRRRPRFEVEGGADVTEIGGQSHVKGRLEQISEYGCLITAGGLLVPGTGLRLVLNMCDVSIALRGHVKYTAENRAMGIEFQEIRQGDRPLLDYVLNRLKKPRVEDFADLEVITEEMRTQPAAIG
ncbi:MAG: PilZ domain-containing protein [Candidatus Sulfotelmatobacter sp.]